MDKTFKELQYETRLFILKAIHNAQSSHVGSALSCIDILIAQMHYIKDVESINYLKSMEQIILSKGHGAAAFYALLNSVGQKIDFKDYYQNDSWLTGHISHKIKSVSHSTGSLGHGLPVACGMAYANRKKHYSVLLSDGEMQEGSNWEALLVAPELKLNNLSIVIDYNNQQSFGKVSDTISIDPLDDKLNSFGWNVEKGDGHDIKNICKSLKNSIKIDKPYAFIAYTTKGKGVSFMEDRVQWHYTAPSDDDLIKGILEIEKKYNL